MGWKLQLENTGTEELVIDGGVEIIIKEPTAQEVCISNRRREFFEQMHAVNQPKQWILSKTWLQNTENLSWRKKHVESSLST